MFNTNKWLRENMVEAVNKGYMSLPCISVKAGDYYKAGMFTVEDVEFIATNAKEPVVIEKEPLEAVEETSMTDLESSTEAGAKESAEVPIEESSAGGKVEI